MLTRLARAAQPPVPGGRLRLCAASLVALALLAAAVVFSAAPAGAAQRCWMEAVKDPRGAIVYVKRCETADPGRPGNGGSGQAPDCGIESYRPYPGQELFCSGGLPCYMDDRVLPGPRPPLAPGQEYKTLWCYPCPRCFGPPAPRTIVVGALPRPLVVQAREAFGELRPPGAVVRHSPTGPAVVALETWFWLDGATFGVQTGSSAEGLVAVAEPAGTTWDPGDGSAAVQCGGAGVAWSPEADRSLACVHAYQASSPGYQGAVTRHWAVHYENGGQQVAIPGAPTELTAGTPFTVSVVESQVVVGAGD